MVRIETMKLKPGQWFVARSETSDELDEDELASIEQDFQDMFCARLRPRDGQRSKVYKADDALKPFAVPLKSVADVERFVLKVWASKRAQAAFPRAVGSWRQPYVKDGRGTRSATGGEWHISIPRWARWSDVVLHELAHVITIREHFSLRVAGHGWQFCGVFLKLVLYIMGREAHDALKASMKIYRVRYRRPVEELGTGGRSNK
jgi:putative metallohydrolase (TIGR04338 family)